MADVYTENMTRLPSEIQRYEPVQFNASVIILTKADRLDQQFDIMTEYTSYIPMLPIIIN